MKHALARMGVAVVAVAVAVGAIACRQGDPALDPKSPPNSPLPKIDRPDEPKGTPLRSDAGATKMVPLRGNVLARE